MVVGPTGGGKSVIINTLIKAQCHMGVATKCTYLNPKVSGIHLIILFQIKFIHEQIQTLILLHNNDNTPM